MFAKVTEFVKEFYKQKGPFKRVLDVGSRNINGSVREAVYAAAHDAKIPFPEEFVGLDMIEGKDVDLVMNAHEILHKFSANYFDLVICCETLEHDDQFWVTVSQMRQVVKAGGWLLVTAPGIFFFRHDFPNDYYRFTDSVFKEVIFKDFKNVYVETFEDPNDPNTEKPNNSILGYGQKPK